MLEAARRASLEPAVLTFHPHPVEVLRPGTRLERITTTDEKLALLKDFGVKRVLVETFTAELAKLSAQDFFERFLVQGLRASSLHVGYDFHFGAGRRGDTALLRELCAKAKMDLRVEEPFELGGVRVSSSVIRQCLSQGEVKKAAHYLGRPFRLEGRVIRGEQRGRKLGFPTANLRYLPEKVLPKLGVYVTRVHWKGKSFKAATNIGVKPTFSGGEQTPIIESHLLDFDSTIYDEAIVLEFLDRIRDEKKFDSVEALKKQIADDVDFARGDS